jgi:hypothetical protein
VIFTRRLRDRVRSGEITCSVHIWKNPRVIVGNRYRMDEGEIEVDSIEPIGLPDITPELARASGFLGVLDLLKVAKAAIRFSSSAFTTSRRPRTSLCAAGRSRTTCSRGRNASLR